MQLIKYQKGMAEFMAENFENLLNQVQAVTNDVEETNRVMHDPGMAEGEYDFIIVAHKLNMYYQASAFIDHEIVFEDGRFKVIIKPFDMEQFKLDYGLASN